VNRYSILLRNRFNSRSSVLRSISHDDGSSSY
jgi:hypothetical protein